MQNELDDIEGLLRRAAESYPLNTSGSNWDAVSSKLDKEHPSSIPTAPKDKINPVILFLLLTLIIGLLINVDWKQSANYSTQGNDAGNHKDRNNNNHIINNSPERITSLSSALPNKNLQKQKQTAISIKNSLQPSAIDDKEIITANATLPHLLPAVATKKTFRRKIGGQLTDQIIAPVLLVTKKDDQQKPVAKHINEVEPLKTQRAAEQTVPFEALKVQQQITTTDTTITASSISVAVKKPSAKNRTVLDMNIIAGPDFSNIKQQSYDQAGLSAGILFSINKERLILQSGLIWDKKFYYSDAQYYKPKQPLPAYVKGIDLSGVCNMFEIPVNLGYSIINDPRHQLILKSGLSSYLMKYEHYDYSYFNSYYQRQTGSVSYKNSSNNFLSVVNLSILYNTQISPTLKLGIEPYFKLPVKGVGYGQMPISSTGMFIVLTRKMF